jgi:hypothetical protein
MGIFTIQRIRELCGQPVVVDSVSDGVFGGVVIGWIGDRFAIRRALGNISTNNVSPHVLVGLRSSQARGKDWITFDFRNELFDENYMREFPYCRMVPIHQIVTHK